MKKLLLIVLGLFAFGLVSCGGGDSKVENACKKIFPTDKECVSKYEKGDVMVKTAVDTFIKAEEISKSANKEDIEKLSKEAEKIVEETIKGIENDADEDVDEE